MKQHATLLLMLVLTTSLWGQNGANLAESTAKIYQQSLTKIKTWESNLNHPFNQGFKGQFPPREVLQKLDSTISMTYHEYNDEWTKSNKSVFVYDENGNIHFKSFYEWDDEFNDWLPSSRIEVVCNQTGALLQEVEYYWTIDSNQWMPSDMKIFELNEAGLVSIEKQMRIDYLNPNQWLDVSKYESTYNNENKLVSELYSLWIEDNASYVPIFHYQYTYDDLGKISTDSISFWREEGAIWKVQNAGTYTYNKNQQDSTIVGLQLDIRTDSLINYYKQESFYDTLGFDKMDVSYFWDKQLNQWDSNEKLEYNYDSEGKRTRLIRNNWYDQINGWRRINKMEFIYDAEGNLDHCNYSTPEDNNQWSLFLTHQFTYDFDYTIDEVCFVLNDFGLEEFPYALHNKFLQFSVLYPSDEGLYMKYKSDYFYSDLQNDVNNENENNLNVFPNPTSTLLWINGDLECTITEVLVYNQLGQNVMIVKNSPQFIDCSNLKAGIYLIELIAKGERFRKKIVVQ